MLKFVFCFISLKFLLIKKIIVATFIINSVIAIPFTPKPKENFGTRHINNIVVAADLIKK